MEKDLKYKLLKHDSINIGETILYRIEALRSFGCVTKGDKGGYIAKESNLSHEGNAWVYGYAKVFDDAKVFGYAKVYGDAWVSGNALVFRNAKVSGNARVFGDAEVSGDAEVFENAEVYNKAKLSLFDKLINWFRSTV